MEDMYSSSVKSIGYLSDMRYGTRYAQGMMIIMTTVKDDPQRMQNLDKKFQEGLKFVEDGIKQYEAVPGKTDAEIVLSVVTRWAFVKEITGPAYKRTYSLIVAVNKSGIWKTSWLKFMRAPIAKPGSRNHFL